jgi:hypothetical protein
MVTSVSHAMPAVRLVWEGGTCSVGGAGRGHFTLRGGVCPTVQQDMLVMVPGVSAFPVLLAVITVWQMEVCAPHAGKDGSKHRMDYVCHQRVESASPGCTQARGHAWRAMTAVRHVWDLRTRTAALATLTTSCTYQPVCRLVLLALNCPL